MLILKVTMKRFRDGLRMQFVLDKYAKDTITKGPIVKSKIT